MDPALPRDDELTADVVEALRVSDVPAGDLLRIAAHGSTVVLMGRVDSIDALDEILAVVGDVPGVRDVQDEIEVSRLS